MIFHKSKIPNMFRLQTTMVLQSYPICFRIFCFVCLRVSGFSFVLIRLSFVSQMRVFCFLCFLIRISIMTASCSFCLAWFHLPSTTYSDGFITISRNRKRKSTNLACNKSFFRYVVEVCMSEQSAPQMRTNRTLLLVPSVVQVLFVCLFVKESLLVNFFVLLQHLCCLCYGTREVNFFCFVFIIGLFNDSSFMKTKNTTWFSIRNNI